MKDLVIMHDQQAVTTSLVLAEAFEKQHKHVIEAIEKKISTAENSALLKNMFIEDSYIASNGKQNKMYYLNRDGFTFIAMGFTGKKADEFKLKYIDAFNKMENQIKEKTQFRLPKNLTEMSTMFFDVMKDQDKKIEEQSEKVNFLMNLSGLTSPRNKELTKARNKKIIQVCGGSESNSYQDKSLRSKLYNELFKSYRHRFDVNQYVDTPMKRFDEAKEYINNWYPPFELKDEIEKANAQGNLF
ncbi:Rha family transcriptional regulator [Ligilactobacillus salivarius]|jgi:Rha family phage regulatory protein|uniref:Rha family transcriptional regulator n=1 Tax=Ligilactobacillus salivarius TaxID=1624 RepID=UPI0013680E5C|nr:Rha family transcriptional regulator [Ligilactobacillus salivarius]MYZ84048.1 phage regulatory protein [Ligilactobacillus salivarius]DAT81075.1 MAG TPA: regulatory protein [Caudoviricetes sp.]